MPPQELFQKYPQINNDIGQMGSIGVERTQLRFFNILRGCPESEGFWASEELLECPSLLIRASLMAADIFNYPENQPIPSLNTDFEIVATTLPYVDILVVDNHMAELIRQTQLSNNFVARVYSMNRRTELLEALQKL